MTILLRLKWSPAIKMVTVVEGTDDDGNEFKRLDHQDMGTMIDIMNMGGQDEL